MKEQDLTLVGLTGDKAGLVLVSDAGEEFTLAVDDALRAAVRGARTRPGQLENTMDSALRPRDIQARIRAGESPESVADAAQTSLDKVMGYATPVLAERAHIADRAQRASIRRKAGEGASRVLADVVAEQLRSENVDPETVGWDAWRREDGRWTLVADYRTSAGSRRAEFVFDAPGRYVVAEDDHARRLVGELPAASSTAKPGGRRLSAVPGDEELPLGEDAIELVSDTPATPSATPVAPQPAPASSEEETVDLSHAARAVRGTEPAGADRAAGSAKSTGATGATGDADWIATQASDRPGPARRPDQQQEPAAPTGEPESADQPAEPAAVEAAEPPEPQPEPKRPRKKSGRASVPSWDEIMFGGGKQE